MVAGTVHTEMGVFGLVDHCNYRYGEHTMILLSVLVNLPPFVGLDGKTWRLRRGDMLSVNPGLPFKQARILVEKGAARWVETA